MKEIEYQREMGRLIEQFGKPSYSPSRLEVFWREVNEFSAAWMEKTVDHFLLTCRQAPLYAEFAEQIGKERERRYELEREQEKQDAKDFWEGTYQPDDVKTICQMIRRRINGQVSDEEYAKFVEHLEHAAKNPKVRDLNECQHCNASGYVFHKDEEGYEFVYRCFCKNGQTKPQGYPVWNISVIQRKGG